MSNTNKMPQGFCFHHSASLKKSICAHAASDLVVYRRRVNLTVFFRIVCVLFYHESFKAALTKSIGIGISNIVF